MGPADLDLAGVGATVMMGPHVSASMRCRGRPATHLSGGGQQKQVLAGTMIIQPQLLFPDVLTAALDCRATREVEAVLRAARASGTRLILSTHDLGQARRLADEVLFLLHGHVQEHSPARQFFEAHVFLRGDIVE